MLPWESVSWHLQPIPVFFFLLLLFVFFNKESVATCYCRCGLVGGKERMGLREGSHPPECMGWPKQPSQCGSRHLMSCSKCPRLIPERTLGLSEVTGKPRLQVKASALPNFGDTSACSQRLGQLSCDDSKDAGIFSLCSPTPSAQINGNEIASL